MVKAKEKRKSGRPRKLTQEVYDQIVSVVGEGNYLSVAVACSSVGQTTVETWLRRGREELEMDPVDRPADDLYQRFWGDVKKAEAEGIRKSIAKVVGDESWQSGAWFAERKAPDDWGRRDRLKVEIEKGIEEGVEAKMKWLLDLLQGDEEAVAQELPRKLSEFFDRLLAKE